MKLYRSTLLRLVRILYRFNYWQTFALIGFLPWVVGLPLLVGIVLGRSTAPDTAFLQREIIKAYADLNKSESLRAELANEYDFVDDSAYRTGLRDACVAFGYIGLDCDKEAAEWVR